MRANWSPVSRRSFVKIMSASFLLAGLGLGATGCRRPEQKIVPFGKMPEDYIHGVAQFYATAMPTRTGAIPLVAKSHEGRPVKVEGNSLHPDSNGGTDRYAQASILNLYDPDRANTFRLRGQAKSPEEVFDYLSSLSREAQANGGQGLSFLMEPGSSPSRRRLQKLLSEKLPQAQWYVHDALGMDVHSRAAAAVFGEAVRPYFRYDEAKVLVSLDCDFLGSEEDVQVASRRFAKGRQIGGRQDTPNRLYSVEGLYTLTGFAADHRLRVPSSAVAQVAAALAGQVLKSGEFAGVRTPEGVEGKWITECAKDLEAHRGQCLVVAGHRQPLGVIFWRTRLMLRLGTLARRCSCCADPDAAAARPYQTIVELAKALNAGRGEHAGDFGGQRGLQRRRRIWISRRLSARTRPWCGWATTRTRLSRLRLAFAGGALSGIVGGCADEDGTLVPIQPLIAPLFGGLTEIEVLAPNCGAGATSPTRSCGRLLRAFVQAVMPKARGRSFCMMVGSRGACGQALKRRPMRVSVARVEFVKPSSPGRGPVRGGFSSRLQP